MKRFVGLLLGSFLLFGAWSTCMAQEKSEGMHGPPKVLVINREFLKPGKAGSAHQKTESAFVQAFAKAKWPTHYFAADSLTGKPRSLFFVGYNSFADWEKDAMGTAKNASLSAALDHASMADGELLSEYDTGAFMYRPDYSLNADVDIAHMRYFEIAAYRVRPGHRKEWDELVQLVLKAYDRVPDSHFAVFESIYGQENSVFLVFVPMKSAAEIDSNMAKEKDFVSAMGEEGMKRLGELEASAIELTMSNLFIFNPSNSYPPDEWVKADPAFWKPRAGGGAPAPAKKGKKEPAKE